ncbi:TRAP transporter small permease subunit [Ponticoccus alexandrii]|uniref:TRAP transporter small permease protein n=1 Tax=Ponticoccus alexandrii TaxID=1943633 RepID=A0ABX7FEQ8_9RHOB|nr:TRAP transporter small permease [Ponticoccus alexandrii]QRF68863.1 TRAP transporter small permease subunit [Ponticoccus alexandrii]
MTTGLSDIQDIAGQTRPAMLFQRGVFALSRAAAVVAALLVVGMVLHILLEIGLRMVDRSTFVLDEMVGYAIAGATFLSLGYAFEHSALVRVGLLVDRLSGRTRRVLETCCGLATLAVTTQIAWAIAKTAMRSFERGRTSSSIAEIPLWIPEAVCATGLAIFSLQILAWILRQILDLPGPVPPGNADPLQNDL